MLIGCTLYITDYWIEDILFNQTESASDYKFLVDFELNKIAYDLSLILT